MIIVCPSCDSQYLVNAKAIGDGRTVKCASCGHTWHQEPVADETDIASSPAKDEAVTEELGDESSAVDEIENAPESEETPDDEISADEKESAGDENEAPSSDDDTSGAEDDTPQDDSEDDKEQSSDSDNNDEYLDSSADTMVDDDLDVDEVLGRLNAGGNDSEQAMDPIPKGLGPNEDDDNFDVTAVPETDTKSGKKFSALGTLVIFLALVTLTIIGGIAYKDAIARAWPPSAGFFDTIGLPVDVVGEGLVLGDVTSMVQKNDGATYLLIRGRIDNVSDESLNIPSFKVELYNDYGFVQEWVTPYEEFSIGAGESVPFEYGLPGIQDENPASVVVTFTKPDAP